MGFGLREESMVNIIHVIKGLKKNREKKKKFAREVEDKQAHSNFKVNWKQGHQCKTKQRVQEKEFKGHTTNLCVILV